MGEADCDACGLVQLQHAIFLGLVSGISGSKLRVLRKLRGQEDREVGSLKPTPLSGRRRLGRGLRLLVLVAKAAEGLVVVSMVAIEDAGGDEVHGPCPRQEHSAERHGGMGRKDSFDGVDDDDGAQVDEEEPCQCEVRPQLALDVLTGKRHARHLLLLSDVLLRRHLEDVR